jgi:hypothetical protein
MKRPLTKIKLLGTTATLILSLLLTSCGTKILYPSDTRLYKKIYLQNLRIVESYEDEETALSAISPARRAVYILSIFDMEVQNGGLCQFFVNSSRSLAPYVNECLEMIGAHEHKKLFSEFVTENNIDLEDLESFQSDTIDEYVAQTKRYDFDSFDDAYVRLTPLQNYIVSYYKTHLSEF